VKELMSTKRDKAWFDRLWSANAGHVRAYLQRRVRPSDYDDLLSEVFVVAWRHRDRKPKPNSPCSTGSVGRSDLTDPGHGRLTMSQIEILDGAREEFPDEFNRWMGDVTID
jgi:hypothetical protein